jgi:aminoglycoside/choline kinase family phosphotransferase
MLKSQADVKIIPSAILRDFVEDFFEDTKNKAEELSWMLLRGDGSDRRFYRVRSKAISIIALEYPNLKVDPEARLEAISFTYIGNHLWRKGIPVPELYRSNPNQGVFIIEDLGDLTLQKAVLSVSKEKRIDIYNKAINVLVEMQINGAHGFDSKMCYQSQMYDREIMLERESKYFLREFVKNMLGLFPDEEKLLNEFQWIADQASMATDKWFLHRDFQSRNLMIKGEEIRVIDFQGGRLGPLQYDIASLLNDPYVDLDEYTRDFLLNRYLDEIQNFMEIKKGHFLESYDFIALQRNLQVLGAFAFLSQRKGRRYFEKFIPPAVRSLSSLISKNPKWPCPILRSLVQEIVERIDNEKNRS